MVLQVPITIPNCTKRDIQPVDNPRHLRMPPPSCTKGAIMRQPTKDGNITLYL